MIVDKKIIQEFYDGGTRISPFCQDQGLAIAKHIISKQIQRPVKEMIAYYDYKGDVVVAPKPTYRKLLK